MTDKKQALSESIPFSGWVSVDDELPEESGKYRVKVRRGSASVTIEETETLFFKKQYRNYWGADGDWNVVTHWKPNVKSEPLGAQTTPNRAAFSK